MDFQYQHLLNNYRLQDIVSISYIESGFESDNFLIKTSENAFVAKLVHQPLDTLIRVAEICQTLNEVGFSCPMTVKTLDGEFGISLDKNRTFTIQWFIEGKPITRQQLKDNSQLQERLYPLYGKILGELHTKGLQAIEKLPEDMQDFQSPLQMNEIWVGAVRDKDILQFYRSWKEEVQELLDQPAEQLTYTIIKGDTKPGDFFFTKTEGSYEFSAMLDFNGARFNPALLDVANMIYYSGFEKPERRKNYLLFITEYFRHSPIRREELQYLHLFVIFRELVGVFLFAYRAEHQITQGTDDNQHNIESLRFAIDSINYLKTLDLVNHFSQLD